MLPLHFRNCTTETIEEEMIWAVDSQIKVQPHSKTTAELVISEDQHSSNFKVDSKVSGRVVVTVTNQNDNNSIVKVIENPIGAIVSASDLRGGIAVEKNVVKFSTVGKCSFRYAVEQHVKLHEEAL